MQDERIPRPMSAAQRDRYERGEVELLDEDRYIEEWLRELLFEAGTPAEFAVGVFRCLWVRSRALRASAASPATAARTSACGRARWYGSRAARRATAPPF